MKFMSNTEFSFDNKEFKEVAQLVYHTPNYTLGLWNNTGVYIKFPITLSIDGKVVYKHTHYEKYVSESIAPLRNCKGTVKEVMECLELDTSILNTMIERAAKLDMISDKTLEEWYEDPAKLFVYTNVETEVKQNNCNGYVIITGKSPYNISKPEKYYITVQESSCSYLTKQFDTGEQVDKELNLLASLQPIYLDLDIKARGYMSK